MPWMIPILKDKILVDILDQSFSKRVKLLTYWRTYIILYVHLIRYILNSVGITIQFYRSKPEFCLMSIDKLDCRIEIEEMYLNILELFTDTMRYCSQLKQNTHSPTQM